MSENCPSYNCQSITTHLLNDCENEFQGGSDQIVLLLCGHTVTDPSNGTQINSNISNGKAVLIRNVKFGLDAPSPIEIESNISCRGPKVVTYDRTAPMIDSNVNSNNVTMYNQLLNGYTIAGIIFFECSANRVTWIDDLIRATGGRIMPNEDNEFQRFETVFKWRSKNEGQIYPAPAGVFY